MIKGRVSDRKKRCQWMEVQIIITCCQRKCRYYILERIQEFRLRSTQFSKEAPKGRFGVLLRCSTKLMEIFMRKVCGETENAEKLKDK